MFTVFFSSRYHNFIFKALWHFLPVFETPCQLQLALYLSYTSAYRSACLDTVHTCTTEYKWQPLLDDGTLSNFRISLDRPKFGFRFCADGRIMCWCCCAVLMCQPSFGFGRRAVTNFLRIVVWPVLDSVRFSGFAFRP